MPQLAMGTTPFLAPDERPPAAEGPAARTHKIARAKAFLVQVLSEGPRPATAMLLAAAAAGIAEGTLYTAKRRLRVESHRQGYEDGQWVWALPIARTRADQRIQPSAPVGAN